MFISLERDVNKIAQACRNDTKQDVNKMAYIYNLQNLFLYKRLDLEPNSMNWF